MGLDIDVLGLDMDVLGLDMDVLDLSSDAPRRPKTRLARLQNGARRTQDGPSGPRRSELHMEVLALDMDGLELAIVTSWN